MNQIFQNMTKGEMTINHWEKGGNGVSCVSMGEVNYYTGDAVDTPHYGLRIKNEGQFANFPASFEGYHIADIYYQCAPQMGLVIALNMKSAWNNTYGKGINPESVDKMKEALEYCLQWNLGSGTTGRKMAEEALTAAKL